MATRFVPRANDGSNYYLAKKYHQEVEQAALADMIVEDNCAGLANRGIKGTHVLYDSLSSNSWTPLSNYTISAPQSSGGFTFSGQQQIFIAEDYHREFTFTTSGTYTTWDQTPEEKRRLLEEYTRIPDDHAFNNPYGAGCVDCPAHNRHKWDSDMHLFVIEETPDWGLLLAS